MLKIKLIKIFNIFVRYSKFFSRRKLDNFITNAISSYYSSGKRVISIGASGQTKLTLQKNKVDFKEVDINKSRKPDYVLDAENMHAIDSGSADMVFCLEVLEHVKNPFNAANEIIRILKPGGVLIGSTPFMMPIHEEPHDYFRFTGYGLLNLFENMNCLELVERNSYIESLYVIFLRLINSGNYKQKIVGVILFPVYLLLLPFVIIFSFFVTNKESTSGYFFIFKK